MLIKVFILFLTANIIFAKSFLTPFIYDLNGVESSGDTIVVFGNLGSGMISFDEGKIWNNIKPYENEIINSIFIKNKKLITFSESGIIKESKNWGESWNEISTINDTIISIEQYNERYYVISKKNIFLLNDKYQILNSYNLRKSININSSDNPNIEPILTFYKNEVIALDSGQIFKFDLNLNIIDTLILPNNLSCYSLYSTTNELFARSHPYLYIIEDFSTPIPFLNYVQKNIDLFDSNDYYVHYFKVINDKLYCFNPFTKNNRYPFLNYYQIIDSNEAILNGTIDFSQEKANGFFKQRLKDLENVGNNLFLVSDKNMLVKYNRNTDETEMISNLYEFNSKGDYLPIRVNDSIAFYQTGNKFFKMNMINKSWERLSSDSIVNSNINNSILFRKFDYKSGNLIYIIKSFNDGIKSILYESKDFGISFSKHELQNLILSQAISILDINHTETSTYVTINYREPSSINEVLMFDKNYNFKESTRDSNFVIKKIKYLSDNKIIRITSDFSHDQLKNDINKISSSNDGGNTWNDIKEYGYSKPDTIIYNDGSSYITSYPDYLTTYDFEVNGVSYWLNAIYSKDKSKFKFDLINLETFESNIIYEMNLISNNGVSITFENYKDTTIIVVNDQIFKGKDIFNINNWVKYKFPNNGRIASSRFVRFGNRYYTSYFDDIHSYNLYWLNFNSENVFNNIKLKDIETLPYFYNSPPYPQPTSSLVTTKVYLDQAINLSKNSIKIFDVNGKQVEKGNNVEISGKNWPTTLTWDSSNQPPGVYFILIEYDGNSKAIKVMKE